MVVVLQGVSVPEIEKYLKVWGKTIGVSVDCEVKGTGFIISLDSGRFLQRIYGKSEVETSLRVVKKGCLSRIKFADTLVLRGLDTWVIQNALKQILCTFGGCWKPGIWRRSGVYQQNGVGGLSLELRELRRYFPEQGITGVCLSNRITAESIAWAAMNTPEVKGFRFKSELQDYGAFCSTIGMGFRRVKFRVVKLDTPVTVNILNQERKLHSEAICGDWLVSGDDSQPLMHQVYLHLLDTFGGMVTLSSEYLTMGEKVFYRVPSEIGNGLGIVLEKLDFYEEECIRGGVL